MLQLMQQQQKQKEEEQETAKQMVVSTPTKRNLPANSVMEGQPIVSILMDRSDDDYRDDDNTYLPTVLI